MCAPSGGAIHARRRESIRSNGIATSLPEVRISVTCSVRAATEAVNRSRFHHASQAHSFAGSDSLSRGMRGWRGRNSRSRSGRGRRNRAAEASRRTRARLSGDPRPAGWHRPCASSLCDRIGSALVPGLACWCAGDDRFRLRRLPLQTLSRLFRRVRNVRLDVRRGSAEQFAGGGAQWREIRDWTNEGQVGPFDPCRILLWVDRLSAPRTPDPSPETVSA